MKKILVVLSILFMLIGCEDDTVVVECFLETETTVMNYEYEAIEDELLKIKSVQESDYVALGYSKEEAKSVVEDYAKMFEEDGISYEYSISDSIITEEVNIDLSVADLLYIEQLGYITSYGVESTVISLEDSVNNFENLGGVCK